MDLRLGHQVFGPGDLVLWHDIAPGAVPLVGDRLAVAAAASGAGLVCTDPARAVALGVRADGVILDAGTMPTAARAAECVASGHPVLVTLAPRPGPSDPSGRDDHDGAAVESADPRLLAAASVYAWLGVRVFRTADTAGPTGSADQAAAATTAALRQVLDMVASIKGTRQPALSRRALA